MRYYLLREVPLGLDGDFTFESLFGRFNAELANDLGNLVNRSLTLIGEDRARTPPVTTTVPRRVRRAPVAAARGTSPTRPSRRDARVRRVSRRSARSRRSGSSSREATTASSTRPSRGRSRRIAESSRARARLCTLLASADRRGRRARRARAADDRAHVCASGSAIPASAHAGPTAGTPRAARCVGR